MRHVLGFKFMMNKLFSEAICVIQNSVVYRIRQHLFCLQSSALVILVFKSPYYLFYLVYQAAPVSLPLFVFILVNFLLFFYYLSLFVDVYVINILDCCQFQVLDENFISIATGDIEHFTLKMYYFTKLKSCMLLLNNISLRKSTRKKTMVYIQVRWLRLILSLRVHAINVYDSHESYSSRLLLHFAVIRRERLHACLILHL